MLLKAPYIHVEDVNKLRDNTRIGELIEFTSDKYARCDGFGYQPFKDTKKVKGIVTAKYPNIFVLNDNETYSWVDYIIGKNMI